jgi:hypothetical protein
MGQDAKIRLEVDTVAYYDRLKRLLRLGRTVFNIAST